MTSPTRLLLLILLLLTCLISIELYTFRLFLSEEIKALVPWYKMPAFYFYYVLEVLLLLALFRICKNYKFLRYGFYISASLFALIYIGQAWAVYLSGGFIGIDALISVYAVKHVLSANLVVGTIAFLLTISAVFMYLYRKQEELQLSAKSFWVFWFVLVVTSWAYHEDDYIRKTMRAYAVDKQAPVTSFIQTLQTFVDLKLATHKKTELEKQDILAARSLGITLTPKTDSSAQDYSFKRQVKHQNFVDKSYDTPPNFIVFMVESLSANRVGAYNPVVKEKGITPNFDRFAENALRVHGYYNHTSPTVRGIYGQMCSIYPTLNTRDYRKNKSALDQGQTRCLPHLLNERGYETIFFTHHTPRSSNFEAQANKMGFSDAKFNLQIHKDILKLPGIPGEITDHQLFQAAYEFLNNRKSEKPLFIVFFNVETHMNDFPAGDDFVVMDGETNDFTNASYNVDHAFGEFYKQFEKTEIYNNSIMLLTGDHASPPSNNMRKSVGNEMFEQNLLSEMAFILKSPLFESNNANSNNIEPNINTLNKGLKVHRTSIDFAPTVMQILGFNEYESNFLGQGLFDKDSGSSAAFMDKQLRIVGDNSINIMDIDAHCEKQNDYYCSIHRVLKLSQEYDRDGLLVN